MALSNFRDTPKRSRDLLDVLLGANIKVYAGGLACTDTATGYGVQGQVKTGLVALGIAQRTVDNTGGNAGDKAVCVETGIFRLGNYSGDLVPASQMGKPCFVYDDEQVAATDGGAARSVAGTVVLVDAAGVWVHIASVNGTSLAAEIAARVAITTDLNGSAAALNGVLTGAAAKNVADANVIGGLPVVHRIAVADGVTGNIDVVLTHKTMLTNISIIKGQAAGGASDTITVNNVANPITNAISINIAAKTVAIPTTIDDAYTTVAAGTVLRIVRTKASAANVGCTVIVQGLRVA